MLAISWASAGGARVLGFPDIGAIAPGKLADIAIFDLASPRYFGLHDPLVGPVTAGAAHVRHLFVGGRRVIYNGAVPGLDLARLRHDAARVVAKLAD